MALQEPMKGTARIKRNSWRRGNGSYNSRGRAPRRDFEKQKDTEPESEA